MFNVFDMIVVSASVVEISVAFATSAADSSSSLTLFRSFRLVRIFKLARQWKSLHRTLRSLQKALKSLGPLSIVLLLTIFIFALLGMQLFGGKFGDGIGSDAPRSNFDSFHPSQAGMGAFMTIFQVCGFRPLSDRQPQGSVGSAHVAA
jgi:voltage-dependent calcium channel L type alpha-1D